MALSLDVFLWIVFSASFAVGNDYFVNPPDLSSQTTSLSSFPVFAVGDILDVSWVAPAEDVDLVINQLNSPVTEIDRTPNSVALTTGTYTWKVTTDGSDGGAKFDLTFSNVFNFMVFKVNSTTINAQSADFDISNTTINKYGQRIPTLASTSTTHLPASSTSLISSASLSAHSALSAFPTSSLASSSTLTTSTNGIPLPQKTDSATSASTSRHLTMAASVGLGIDLGIIGAAAIAGLTILILSRKRKHKAQQTPPPPHYNLQDTETSPKGDYAHSNWYPPIELPVLATQGVERFGSSSNVRHKGLLSELPS